MWMFLVVWHLSGEMTGPAQPSFEGDVVAGSEFSVSAAWRAVASA